jgi:hypothetical protein
MLQYGTNITSGTPDPLTRIETGQLFKIITEGSNGLGEMIHQLRTIQVLDPGKYKQLKVKLPYFTCGIFHPPYRRTEFLAYADSFVIDLDSLQENEINPDWLKQKLSGDERISLAFISPGGNGLKAILPLAERISDPGKFKLVYRVFLQSFSDEYGLKAVTDYSTCDVTRACFLSHDPEAFYNPNAIPLQPSALINFDSIAEVETARELLDLAAETGQDEKNSQESLTDDQYLTIRRKLNPKGIFRRKKRIYVPAELNSLEDSIRKRAEEVGIVLEEIRSIHYGKQVEIKAGNLTGEVNVFYGKRGYTVVGSMKSGCDEKLNELAEALVTEVIGNIPVLSMFYSDNGEAGKEGDVPFIAETPPG